MVSSVGGTAMTYAWFPADEPYGVRPDLKAHQDSAVHARVEGLHAAGHDLGRARIGLDRSDGDPFGGERRQRAPRREKLEAALDESAGERDEAGLVGNREEGERHAEGLSRGAA